MKSRFKAFGLLMLAITSPLLAMEGAERAQPVQVAPGRDAGRASDQGHAVVGNRMERIERVSCGRAVRPCYPRHDRVVVAGRWDPVLYERVRCVRRPVPVVREVVVVEECPCCYAPVYEECDSCGCGFEFSIRSCSRRHR